MNALDANAVILAATSSENIIENRTFAEISVGDAASLTRQATRRDIDLLAIVSGDVNPIHMDAATSRADSARTRLASCAVAGLISRAPRRPAVE